jgi:hypothetical protein
MRLFNEKLTKTYATPENAEKAVKVKGFDHLRYVIVVDGTGRYIACFLGEAGVQAGVHHAGFCVAN